MAKVIGLKDFELKKAARTAFLRWPRRMGYDPAPDAFLSHLPDGVLVRLARLDNDAILALYDVVMGVRGLGAGEGFDYLASSDKLAALDGFFFLADQVRFELMRRLGWVKDIAAGRYPILELAARPLEIAAEFQPQIPRLTSAYHAYYQVKSSLAFDGAAVVRSLIPEALQAFEELVARGRNPA